MLEINMDDVIAVVQSIQTELIAFAVFLVLPSPSRWRSTAGPCGTRPHATDPLHLVGGGRRPPSITMMLTGPLEHYPSMATATKHELTAETICKTNQLVVTSARASRRYRTMTGCRRSQPAITSTYSAGPPRTPSAAPVQAHSPTPATPPRCFDGLHNAGYRTNDELTKFYTDST